MNNANEMQDLVQDFILETDEIIESLDQDLIELENRKNDFDLLNKIFRAAHTMKGASSFLGFDKMSSVTHHAEEILNKLRKNEMQVTPEIMDILLEFVDVTKTILGDIKNGTNTAVTDEIVAKLKLANEGKLGAGAGAASGGAKRESVEQVKKAAVAVEQTIRVDVSRLDSLMNLVGELVLSRNRIGQISGELEKKFEGEFLIEQLMETTSQIGLISTELQLAVMKTRMVPIGKVFNKFPRMVRDLCRDMGKDIDLVIAGEETELDKSVVEEIGDPLMHMIRNAVDHGVEIPSERRKKGKPDKGIVNLSAYHEGNHIVVEIKDDGKGLDAEMLKRKAVEKNVISAEEAKNMDNETAYGLIFRPGFSTAAAITDVSGRGVGMDVVKTNIEKLNGIINIESEIGHGTRFKMKLPLTLAIIQALLVEVSGEILAIPLVSVIETVRINEKQIHSFEGREVLKLRDSVLSLIRLNEIYEFQESYDEDIYVVVVGIAEKRLGFIVNKLVGQEEIVIKSLGEYLSGNEGIAGATIMGDGRVRLIIDVAGVMEIASKMPRRFRQKKKAETNKKQNNKITVMIIDDSATDRKIISRLLSATGWMETKEVTSGKDAIKIIDKLDPDIVITDIMMPDMDGYEVARALREKGYEKPIIAASGRSEISERKKISAAGIDAFLLKPLNMQMLMDKIDELMANSSNS
ncbi:hybrid sensor histidine kinase/response regulator [Seleniivibrio woodruffii]|uniref:histidine kinase n=1 Tax=Seleniivibrio woodruffii TaxID=1078050 RepID=A0A4R1KB91_9BACT|nr:hybrid sensor histidine kinase/response regulator [Seleniivibrio woodruffii]TCK61735.1 two-component system chemotaxis sensor kinase CheA [Seleniivibrio woodruffii]TVZ35150.1 two-component system chemotaxis sensor kinase CheA [Seleniivibrio woodruffii]